MVGDASKKESETGMLSNDQLDFGRNAIAAGADYRVARSIEKVQAMSL
jgi:hypothetical protein